MIKKKIKFLTNSFFPTIKIEPRKERGFFVIIFGTKISPKKRLEPGIKNPNILKIHFVVFCRFSLK